MSTLGKSWTTAAVSTRGDLQQYFSVKGQNKPKIYSIWSNMRQRCKNPKANGYKRYGGRGITICEEWNDYETFLHWALPQLKAAGDNYSIDRIDNDGNYCPENCRMIDRVENTRRRYK